MNTRSFLLSILIAGVVIGFLANLPILNLINCALCIWVWFGGGLSVFLYRRFQKDAGSVTAGQGATLGAISGLVGAFIGALVFLATSWISVPLFNNLALALEYEGDLPFKTDNLWNSISTMLIFLVLDAVLYPLFGAISGAIAAGIFKKPQPKIESAS